MKNKPLYIIFSVMCVLIAFYPLRYLFFPDEIGLLSTKPADLLVDTFWNIGFYSHIYFSGIALLIGWAQFNKRWRNQYMAIHRLIGRIYVVCGLVGSLAGIYIGLFATGGMVSVIGFVLLGIIWFTTTLKGFLHIKRRNILAHQNLMIYSYAACFAAVTLRIWLPILVTIFGEFTAAYQSVAWLCWIPNMIVAWIIVNKLKQTQRSPLVFKK